MGACRPNVAEQEWRESWEPVLPLVAPCDTVNFAVEAGEREDAWTQAKRHLEYMVQLAGWLINTKSEGVPICADAELHAIIETVDQIALQVTSNILQGPCREISSSVCDGSVLTSEGL